MRLRIHISGLLLAISCWLLAVGCSSSDETGGKQSTVLTVYVYSPARPMLIRSSVGPVDASAAETEINKIQIWIFESSSGRKVGYLYTDETSLLNTSEGATYQMIVDDDFAQHKPDVDVYVLANVGPGNCGVSLFNESSTRDALRDNAKITEAHFGLSPLMTEIPTEGIPMVGVLRNQPVIGDAPVLRIGTQTSMANVRLERAVSKMRFVFANTTGDDNLVIKDITLNAGMMPTEEYLIPQQGKTLTYNTAAASLLPDEIKAQINPVDTVANPTIYIYDGQNAQTYESLINNANLTTVGPYYLRESDKQLAGTISYSIGGVAQEPVTFKMDVAGDFMRNRTWIVYAYHAGGGFLQTNTLYIKDWTTKTEDHEVYNW